MKITPQSSANDSEVIMPAASTSRKNKKKSKKPEDMPAKVCNIKKLLVKNTKETVVDRTTTNKSTVCCALLIDFASININIEKCEKNANYYRRFVHKNKSNFNSAFKNFLKSKVKASLKMGNDVTSKYYIVEFKSAITLAVHVRNTCPFSADLTKEILKLCDTTIVDDVVATFNNNI